MVVDTSALLALFFGEEHGAWAARQMDGAGRLCMSTVNLTETLIRLQDRSPERFPQVERELLGGTIEFVPPDTEQAQIAAEARLRWPLNLGDCFAYALARTRKEPLLAVDRDFGKTDIRAILP